MVGEGDTEKRRKRAQESNDRLLNEIVRTIAIRAIAVLGCVAATGFVVMLLASDQRGFFLALVVPVGMGYIFTLFLLDAIGQWREVKGRRWSSLTPRFVKSSGETKTTSDSAAAKPTS